MLTRERALSGWTGAACTYVGRRLWAGGMLLAILVAGLLCLRGASLVDAASPAALVGEKVRPGPKLSPLGDGRFEVTFSYRPKSATKSVYLAGTFNEWKPTAHSMNGPDGEGRFTTRLELKEGRYEYKFVVNGRSWKADPENVLRAGFHQNSVLYVGTADDNRSKLGQLEGRIATAYMSAAPAVVWIGPNQERLHRTGVVLTADGFVVTSAGLAEGATVALRAGDGRRVKGTVLRCCHQWAASVVKISDPGPWPHVEPARPSELKPGDLCIALEYPRESRGSYDEKALLRIGEVNDMSSPSLGRVTTRAGAFGAAVFELEGRLIGITGGGKPPNLRTVVGADRLMAIRDAVAAGKPLPDVYCIEEGTAGDAGGAECTKDRRPDEERSGAALKRAKPASVRIAPLDELEYGLSGVLVSAEGHVITCAHHGWLPGKELKVFLPDGRAPDAKMMGSSLLGDVDIGLVKITEKGPWPYVEMGDSLAMKGGDACIAMGYPASAIHMLPLSSRVYSYGLRLLGYPRQERPDGEPLVRQVTVVEPPAIGHKRELALYTAGGEFLGGDSGGGVFSLDGRVIGVHLGPRHVNDAPVFQHARVELFKGQWDVLNAAEPVGAAYSQEFLEMKERIAGIARRLPSVAVEVRAGRKHRALGTIVDSGGWILTKASELEGEVSCRLSDGRELRVTERRVSHEHDLALVKVEASDLPVPDWSDRSETPVGRPVATLRPGMPAGAGVIAHTASAIPWDRPFELASLARFLGGEHGLEMVDNLYNRMSIRQGDVIVDVEGQPTPDREAFLKLDEAEAGVLPAHPGDPMRMGVLRAGRRVELQFRMPSYFNWFLDESEESNRSSGFPAAFGVDVELSTDQCGGPVIDPSGRVIGVTIACRGARVYAIPAAAVREVAETLMR